MVKRIVSVVAASLLILSASTSEAHDLWVVPGKFILRPGETIRVFLNSGYEFPISESLLGEHRVQSFNLITASGTKPITSLVADGKSLTAEMTVPDEGTAMLALAIRPRLVRLKAEDFNMYLKEDGLPQILAQREQREELDQPVVERYTKWAKAILRIGEGRDETWRQPVGHQIEIVPEKSPYELGPAEKLPIRVLFDGDAFSGLTVIGARAEGPRNEIHGVTDSEGRARLVIPGPGRWYLHTIHMIRLEEDPQVHYESFWATLTFEVRP